MAGYLAMIIPIDPSLAPSHPIAPGGPPPVAGWTPPGYQPGQGLPGAPPVAGWGPGFPTNPIVIPPGALGPNLPSLPIVFPPEITHPIVIPPGSIAPGLPVHPITLPHPDQSLPGQQPGGRPPIASTGPGFPTNPIVIPPVPPTAPDDKALVFVKTAGADGVWFILDKNSELKPGGVPQPKK